MIEKNVKNDFFKWASNQSFIDENIDYNDLIKVFATIEKYALKKSLLYQPFFETVDLVTVRKVSERINKDKQFEIRNYFSIKRIKKWLRYYLVYLQEKHEQSGSNQNSLRASNSNSPLKSSEGSIPHDEKGEEESGFNVDEEAKDESELVLEDAVEDESEFDVDEEVKDESELVLEDAVEDESEFDVDEEAEDESELVLEDTVEDESALALENHSANGVSVFASSEKYINNECQKKNDDIVVIALDNENIKNLINTVIPSGIEYFGVNSYVSSSWTDAYKNVVLCLMEDYPEIFGKEIYLNIDNEYKYIVAKKKYIDLLEKPIDLNEQLCLETKLEEHQMIKVLRELCNRCNLDQNNITFLCHAKEKKENSDSLYDDDNADGTNFCDDSQVFVVEGEVTSIDLGQKNAANILAQATPVGVQYFEQIYDGCEDWIQAYKQLVLCLQEDYPSIICNEILVRLENEIKLICTRETKAYLLNRPEKIGEQSCLETDVDVKQIVYILRELANRCNVDFDNMVILYKERVQISDERVVESISSLSDVDKDEDDNLESQNLRRQDYIEYLKINIESDFLRVVCEKELDLIERIMQQNNIGTGTLYNVKSLDEGLNNVDLIMNHPVFIERNKVVGGPKPTTIISIYKTYLQQRQWNQINLETKDNSNDEKDENQHKEERYGNLLIGDDTIQKEEGVEHKGYRLNKVDFSRYLDKQVNLKESAKKEYKIFISICESFIWSNKIGSGTLYGDLTESEAIFTNIDKLLKNKSFQEVNKKRNYGLSAALKKYSEYIHQIIDGAQFEKNYASLTKELIIEDCDEKQVVPTKKTNIGKDEFFKYLRMKEQILPNNRRLYTNKILACEVFAEVNRIGKGLYEAESLGDALKTAELLLKSEDFANYSRNQEDIPKKALENYLEFLETNKNKVEKDDISLICQNKLENSGEKHEKTSSSEYQQKALNKVNLDRESFEYYLKKYVNISDKARTDYLRKINDCESFVVSHLLGGGLYSAPSVEVALETVDKLLDNEKFALYSKARLNKPFEALKVYENFLNMKVSQLNAFDSIENKSVSKDYQRELNEILSRLEKKYKDCPAENFQQVLKENSYAYYVDEMYKNVYGISAKEGLVEKGIILSNKEKLDKIVETLQERYREEKAATFYELRRENPDINFNLVVKMVPQIYNKKIKAYFEEVGILKIPSAQDSIADNSTWNKNEETNIVLENICEITETASLENDERKKVETILGLLEQRYKAKPAESLQQIYMVVPAAKDLNPLIDKLYGMSIKEWLIEKGFLLSDKQKLANLAETLKERYSYHKATSVYKLTIENPDINPMLFVELPRSVCGKSPKEYFEEIGVLKVSESDTRLNQSLENKIDEANDWNLDSNTISRDEKNTARERNLSETALIKSEEKESLLKDNLEQENNHLVNRNSDGQQDVSFATQNNRKSTTKQEEPCESNSLVELTADNENAVVSLERIEKDGIVYRFLKNQNELFTIDKDELRLLQRAINRELMSKNFSKQGFTEEEVLFIESCNTGLYFGFEEMKRAFRRQFPDRCDDVFTPSNLIDIGYRYLRNNLVVVEEIRSVEELIERLFFKNRVVDFSENEWILKYNGVYTILSQMKRSYSIVEFEKNKFVNIRELHKSGMNRALLEDYCEQVKKYAKKKAFSVFYLQSSGFKHTLDDFGFEIYFYESVLKNNSAFKSTKYKGQILFKQTNEKFSYSDLIVEIIEREGTMDIYDIQQLLANDYGVKIDLYNIRNFAKEGDLYYSDTMEKIYLDYDDFFEEI